MSTVATQRIAWLAGLFEGEGGWRLDSSQRTFSKVTAALAMCDEDIVRRAHEWSELGSFYGPIPPRVGGLRKKDKWIWQVGSSTDTYALYLGLEPYLGVRRKERFLEFLDIWSKGRPRWPTIDKPKRCYISGKMRGLPQFGFPLFDEARDSLLGQGWQVVSPADLDRAVGFSPKADGYDFHIIRALKRDFDAIKKVDAIILLSNWKDSVGAKAEKLVAERLGKKVLYYVEGEAHE